MAYCSVCGKPAPCGVTHKKSKPTERSRAFALSRKASGSGSARPMPVVKTTTEWYIHGPNQSVKNFPGTVTVSKGVSVLSTAKGRYYAFKLVDHLSHLKGNALKVFGIVIRFCSDVGNGSYGLVKGWDSSNPTPPNPLMRRKFTAGLSTGFQLVAPTDSVIDDLPNDLWMVFHFDVEFNAAATLWTRDSYVQHSVVPKIQIPPDVLTSEKSSSAEDNRG